MPYQLQRWSDEETRALHDLRESIGAARLTLAAQHEDVIGDRKLLRFLRGHDYNIVKVTEMFNAFLDWRKENRIDAIRNEIITKKLNHPKMFPNGEKILSLVPQIILGHDAKDIHGCPTVIDQYCFSPSVVFDEISIADYMVFIYYTLEYRSLILEQLSDELEQKNKHLIETTMNTTASTATAATVKPYGVILYTCVIRDLKGVGFDHFSTACRDMISRIIKVASDNYPEQMRKCYIVNTPFVFHAVWYFIQGLLSPK
jgi:CRAL/TRIO domain